MNYEIDIPLTNEDGPRRVFVRLDKHDNITLMGISGQKPVAIPIKDLWDAMDILWKEKADFMKEETAEHVIG